MKKQKQYIIVKKYYKLNERTWWQWWIYIYDKDSDTYTRSVGTTEQNYKEAKKILTRDI